ncbi:MAG: LPS assembly protein LptD [Planctomycetota bacterium]|nr:LPS assembly protein LptD [Planctomycetota bacterium]
MKSCRRWTSGPGKLLRAAGCCAAVLLGASGAMGQRTADPVVAGPGPAASGGFDGKTFAEVNLPAAVQQATLQLSAARVWTWREGNTERLLLEREARVRIGAYSFRARKAVIWIEPVRVNGVDAEQVAVYFDTVSDPGGPAGLSQQGRRLLVTAVIARSEPTLKADILTEGRAADPFVMESEGRLARYLFWLVNGPAGDGSEVARGQAGAGRRGAESGGLPEWATRDDRGAMEPAERVPAEYPREGLVSLFFDSFEQVDLPPMDSAGPGDARRAMVLTGGVVVQYTPVGDGLRTERTVQLSAERAVVFLDGAASAGMGTYELGEVRGVYLEGDVVATTGDYTLRGRRVYYDLATDRAVVLDAVFWTYDEARGMPLYLRAEAIRQESRSQWSASDVRLANVGFAEPHFSIGATQVTLTRQPRGGGVGAGAGTGGGAGGAGAGGGGGGTMTLIDAEGVTFRFGETPVMYLPGVKGEARPSVLRSASIDSEQGDPIVRTGWDLYTIFGVDAAPGNEATLLLDGYFNRGPAGGADVAWQTEELRGTLLGYYIYDDGTDLLPTGAEIRHNEEHRGLITADQVWRLSEEWTLFLEGSYISDETFVAAFFRSDAQTRREYINSAYLRYLSDNTGFSLEGRGTFNDFLSNEYLLQSLGYTTEKLPEARYYRVADDLFDGLLSYSSQSSLSAMRLEFQEPELEEFGFKNPRRARAAFGLDPDDSIADALREAGVSEDETYRADTRHEIEMPLRAGALNIVPFVTGRATAWDDNFDEFSGETDNDPYRLYGSAGLRLATTVQRVDDSVDSRAFDLRRMRHIVEPSATLWASGTTLEQSDLPIYDDDVESIAHGTAARVGVRNTWQTQRGGEGRWRSVDWLVIDTDYVWSSNQTDRESPLGRFIEATPEQSNFGEFINNDATLQLTDALALTNNVLYDVENQTVARVTAGGIIDHGFGFSTLAEYRYLDTPRATLVDLGARYELTRKYAVTLVGTVDAERTEFQEVSARLERRFPQWTVDLRISVDNVTNEVSGGMALRPAGLGNENRTRVLTRDVEERPVVRRVAPGRERLEWGPFE